MDSEMFARRQRQKEMRVESLWLMSRRDPVREVRQQVGGGPQVVVGQHPAEADPSLRQRGTIRLLHRTQPFRIDQIIQRARPSEQNPAFLESLANSREPEQTGRE